MAGILNTVYTILVLALALVGVAFVFTRASARSGDGESNWTQWGELVAVAVFLIAMVATLLLAA